MASNRKPPKAAWILLLVVMVPQLGLTLANPSNTAIAGELDTSVAAVEATLTAYMVGYAVSMFVSGTLADRFDATRLQAVGLGLFAAGCVFAALAPTVAFLGVSRFLQALGGTSTTVLCRIIVQRRYPADRRISVLTTMSMVISLTPSLSPLVGGLAAQVLDWRALFLVLAVFAVAMVPLILALGGAVADNPRLPSPRQFAGALRQALTNARFRWYVGAISLVWMTYFGFVSSSTTILQDLMGQSAVAYGALMAVPALGYLSGSMLVKRASDASRAVVHGLGLGLVGVAGALALAALGVTGRPVPVVAAMAVTFIGVGATIPFTQAGLLGLELDYPGVAAGLFFFIQMAGGAGFSALVRALSLTTVPAFLAVIVIPQIIVTVMVFGGRVAATPK
ncbi:MFS transporter [Corynebacterium frankenforstense]